MEEKITVSGFTIGELLEQKKDGKSQKDIPLLREAVRRSKELNMMDID